MSVFVLQYARALADVVMSAKLNTGEVDRQLREFQGTFDGSKELREVFENPSIQLDAKLKVLDAMAPRIGLLPQVRNFLAVLLQNGRIHALAGIAGEYRSQINARLGIGAAVITSTRELSADEKSKLENKASMLAGIKIEAVYRQDPSLLGGVVLRIGDTVYDGSVRRRLEELRETLLAD